MSPYTDAIRKLRKAGCKCPHPDLSSKPDGTLRCRICNVEVKPK